MGIFRWLKRKNSECTSISHKEMEEGIFSFVLDKKLQEVLSKADSLFKLNRADDAKEKIFTAINMIERALAKYPHNLEYKVRLLEIYLKINEIQKAKMLFEKIKKDYDVDQDTLKYFEAMFLKDSDGAKNNNNMKCSVAYVCLGCGRLKEYLSLPCIHCKYIPVTDIDIAKSYFYSTAHFSIFNLVMLSREMLSGRNAEDIVINSEQGINRILASGELAPIMKKLKDLSLSKKDLDVFTADRIKCQSCHKNLELNATLFEEESFCSSCGKKVNLGTLDKYILSLDFLQKMLEIRIEPSDSDAFANFTLQVISLYDEACRSRSIFNKTVKDNFCKLLGDLKIICDSNRGGVIDISEKKIYLIKDNYVDGNELYTQLIWIAISGIMETPSINNY